MNLDENISKIIANYLLGEITPEENDVLQEWLSDSYNELVFRKITNEKTISDELAQLDSVDSHKAYKIFRSKISKGVNWQKAFAYAASILVPITIGVLVIFLSDTKYDDSMIAEVTNFDKENVSLLAGDGKLYTIKDNDTLVNTSNAEVIVKGDSIWYQDQLTGLAKDIVYNTINIPAGKRYKLELSDGTIVHLNSETTLKYPIDFVGDKRSVQLLSGEAYFDVKKDDKPFILDFGINKIKVLGTKFNVKSYKSDKKEQITLEEGSILLDNSMNEVKLLPNQQAVINKDDLSIHIDAVDASIYSAWRSGFLNYKNEMLSEILNDLQRQYNIKLFYQNQGVKNKRLSISMNTNKKFTQILKAIEATGGVEFEINNSVVIVKKK